jgi:hypothetical protein
MEHTENKRVKKMSGPEEMKDNVWRVSMGASVQSCCNVLLHSRVFFWHHARTTPKRGKGANWSQAET